MREPMTDEAGLRMIQRTEDARGCHHLAKACQAGADALARLHETEQRLTTLEAIPGVEELLLVLERTFEEAPERPDDTWLREGNNDGVANWCLWAEREITLLVRSSMSWQKDAESWHRNYDSANEARRVAETKVARLEAENAALRERLEPFTRERLEPTGSGSLSQRQQQKEPEK